MENKSSETNTITILQEFITKYGTAGLITALRNFEYLQQTYIYNSNHKTKRIPVSLIDYVEIYGHDITIHTTEGDFNKYGTLKEEYALLSAFGFVKCSQSILIPVTKIKEINKSVLQLMNGTELQITRSCYADLVTAYTRTHSSDSEMNQTAKSLTAL